VSDFIGTEEIKSPLQLVVSLKMWFNHTKSSRSFMSKNSGLWNEGSVVLVYTVQLRISLSICASGCQSERKTQYSYPQTQISTVVLLQLQQLWTLRHGDAGLLQRSPACARGERGWATTENHILEMAALPLLASLS
jgi:hypothetical protein